MPRLIDDIRARGVQMPFSIERSKEDAWLDYAKLALQPVSDPMIPVLLIDNVADYYFVGTAQEYWSLERDFPNVAPPFPYFWCEHRLNLRIHSDEKGDTDLSVLLGKDAKVGVLCVALDPKDVKGEGIPEEAKWIYWMDLFIQYGRDKDGRAHGPHGSIHLAVDAQGRVLGVPWMQSYMEPAAAQVAKSLMTWLHPTLLAICFLHCKNVTVSQESVPKPLAKKYHARTGHWPTPYRTLVIEPLKEILRREGKSGTVGLAKAMHICRGHFRDYREGKGLFGKYNVVVWTPQTVRGTKGESAPPREIKVKI
jgi:hypothetical protein